MNLHSYRAVLDERQLSQLPLISVSLAVAMVLSSLRDLIIWESGEPGWMLGLSGLTMVVSVVIAVLAQAGKVPANRADIVVAVLLLCFASKPIATILIDLAPAPLYIASVICAAALCLHSVAKMLCSCHHNCQLDCSGNLASDYFANNLYCHSAVCHRTHCLLRH